MYLVFKIKRLCSGSIGTDRSAWVFCQISSGELSTASAEGDAGIMVLGEHRRQLDDVSYQYVFEGLYKIIVSVEDFDAL